MSWPTVELGDVAVFVRGVTFKPENVAPPDGDGTVACMRTKNVQEQLDTTDVWGIPRSLVKRSDQYLIPGDTLVSSANSWNLVGKCCWCPDLGEPATFGGFVSVLRAEDGRLEPRYLFRWFSSPRVQQLLRTFGRKTTSISNLDLAQCRRLSIPLPPLDEQRRIARVLDAANALRAKRRLAVARADALVRAHFSDVFAGPTPRALTRRQVPLGDVLERIESGNSPICAARPAMDDEWGVLKLGSVSFGRYRAGENKALLPGTDPMRQHEVSAGDVLLVRKNTYELVGTSVRVRTTPPRLLLPDLIFRLVPGPDIRPAYLQAALSHPAARAQMLRLAGGSAGSMPNISKGRLRTIEIVVPSLEEQRAFEALVSKVDCLRENSERHLAHLDALFGSLEHGAFAGTL